MDIKEYISSGIIEMYVMGLCSPEEEGQLESLRRQYPELDEAIVSYELEMEKNLMQHSSLPGEVTDRRILSIFEEKKPEAKAVPISSSPRWLKPVSVAAAILLLASAGANFYFYSQNKKMAAELSKPAPGPAAVSNTLPENDYKILNMPGITPVAMYGVGIHSICRCTMFWDKKTGKLYIMIHHLPKAPVQRNYQLWAMVDGKPVSVGMVDAGIRGKFIELSNTPENATAFSVTLEPRDGSSVPTEKETYLRGSI